MLCADVRDYPHLFISDRTVLSIAAYNKQQELASNYVRRLQELFPIVGEPRLMTGCLLTQHSSEVVERFKKTSPGSVEPISRFPRLSWSGNSPTLVAGTGSERGCHTASRPIHPEQHRTITVPEAARCQSFPDWFRFHPTNWQGMRQVGNAVPPLLGYGVARAIQPVLTSKVSTVGYATMEGEESKPAAVVPTKLAVGLHQIEIRRLVPHPCNASIYGEDEDVSSLVESIRISGWIKPLVVTPSYIIISGHRRWQAALVLGLETVPVEVREFSSSATELQALLLENDSRHKTIEQKVREANTWRDIESELARMRKLATLSARRTPSRCAK